MIGSYICIIQLMGQASHLNFKLAGVVLGTTDWPSHLLKIQSPTGGQLILNQSPKKTSPESQTPTKPEHLSSTVEVEDLPVLAQRPTVLRVQVLVSRGALRCSAEARMRYSSMPWLTGGLHLCISQLFISITKYLSTAFGTEARQCVMVGRSCLAHYSYMTEKQEMRVL